MVSIANLETADEAEDEGADGAPFDGHASWRAARTLRDGSTVTVRPLVADDREALRAAYRETSESTRYLRFLGLASELTESMLTYLTDVDQKSHIALVATITSPDLKTERGLGVARLIRDPDDPTVAEAAITVADDMQRRGVGLALARELQRAARVRGIRTIRADVLEKNEAMRAILELAGATRVDARASPGTLSYDVPIAKRSVSEARLVDVLRGAAQTMAMTFRKLVPPSG